MLYTNTYREVLWMLSEIFLKVKAHYIGMGYCGEDEMQLEVQRGKCNSIKFTS